MRSVRISAKDARYILALLRSERLDRGPAADTLRKALGELERALAVKPAVRAARKAKAAKRGTKRAAYTQIRKAVADRAPFVCECGCLRWFRGVGGGATVDHFFGRSRDESVASCWRLRFDCHEQKTLNQPNAAHWIRLFIAHCYRHGYHAEASKARARLEAIEMTRGAAR